MNGSPTRRQALTDLLHVLDRAAQRRRARDERWRVPGTRGPRARRWAHSPHRVLAGRAARLGRTCRGTGQAPPGRRARTGNARSSRCPAARVPLRRRAAAPGQRARSDDRTHEPCGTNRVVGSPPTSHRGANVLQLRFDLQEPAQLVRAAQPFGGRLREVDVEVGVAVAQLGALGIVDPFFRVLADRFQEPVATLPRRASSATTSERATNAESKSSTSTSSIPAPEHTASAASRLQPPANTDKRASTRCSSAASRS